MNVKVLQDIKVVSGLISSIILSGIAIVLALYNISYWVFFVVVSWVVLFLSAHRADKIMKN
ncbi:hypothetical protein ACS127_08790 [Amphibacillus sp. Q70]|uniref:hypothetical protein n=1 Tax=Amphibacillus sp. Q70 TaxID=3453416 RepID=UPI003F835C8A